MSDVFSDIAQTVKAHVDKAFDVSSIKPKNPKLKYRTKFLNPVTNEYESVESATPMTAEKMALVMQAAASKSEQDRSHIAGATAGVGTNLVGAGRRLPQFTPNQKTTPAAVKGFNASNKAAIMADYEAKQTAENNPFTNEGMAGIPLPPSNVFEANKAIRKKTGAQVQKGAQALTTAVGGAAQLGAALATGGASTLASVGLEGVVNALFGPPGEADAAFALLPSVLRGSKMFMSALKSKNITKARQMIQEADALGHFGAKEPGVEFRPKTEKPKAESPPPKTENQVTGASEKSGASSVKGFPDAEPHTVAWYHGTAKKFEGELSDNALHNDMGIFLTSDKGLATEYTRQTPFNKAEPPSGTLIEADVKPSKVYDIRFGRHNPKDVSSVLDALINRADKLADSTDSRASVKALSAFDGLNKAKEKLLAASNPTEWKDAEASMYNFVHKLSDAEGRGVLSLTPLREELRALGYDAVRKVDDGSDTLVALDASIIKRKPAVNPKPVETKGVPKVETPSAPKEPTKQGISHAEIDDIRNEIGWEPRKRDPKTDAQMVADSKLHEGSESVIAARIKDDVDGVETLAEHEALALGKKLKGLRDELRTAKKANDGAKYDLLDTQAQQIADALDISGSRQGRAFRARQFLHNDLDEWVINRRAQKANGGVPVEGKRAAEKDKIIADLEAKNATLTAERDQARKDAFAWVGNKAKSNSSKGPKLGETRRSDALGKLRRLGVPVADDAEQVVASGGMKSKQSGAIHIPQGSTEQVAQAVRGLTKSYGELGAKNWGDVLKRLQKDLPGIEEDQALYILSGKYKTAKLEADIARRNADQFLRRVKSDAQYRAKPIAMKALGVGFDILNTTQRSLQTTLDDSMALIQGKNVLTWKPGTWIKGVGKGLQAGFRLNPIEFAEKHLVDIQNDPLYSRAVQAKLALSDVKGSFQAQEEFMAGRLENHIPGLANSKGMATVTMNEMRFDLFRKLAAAGPDNPDYLEDIARIINVATGKGDGKLAQWIGNEYGGLVFYAPRYYVSKWQHNFGQPFFAAKTKEGMGQAAKMYGSQLAGYGMLLRLTQELGFEVELDPRSANFGRASNGQWSFDVFNQQSEGLRTLAQLAYGRISKKGNYTEPGEFGDYSPWEYVKGKASPLIRTEEMLRTGKVYDDELGKSRTATAADFWGNYIPLSVKESMKAKNPKLIPLSAMGGNVDKPFNPKGDVPKFDPVPPGVRKMTGG